MGRRRPTSLAFVSLAYRAARDKTCNMPHYPASSQMNASYTKIYMLNQCQGAFHPSFLPWISFVIALCALIRKSV